jgi:hypothetical protein
MNEGVRVVPAWRALGCQCGPTDGGLPGNVDFELRVARACS